jgi:hypothetical protein
VSAGKRVLGVESSLASDPLTPRPPLPQGGEGEKEIWVGFGEGEKENRVGFGEGEKEITCVMQEIPLV